MKNLLFVCFFLVFQVGFLYAQNDGGSITGTVKDDLGKPLKAATVTARDTKTGLETVAQSDESGIYLLALPAGVYNITAKLEGFGNYEREGVVVQAGIQTTVDAELSKKCAREPATL